jgi:hypothetical protein
MTEAELIQSRRREELVIAANYHQEMARAKFHPIAGGWFTDEETIAERKREAAVHYAKARECVDLLLSGEPIDFVLA